MAGFFGLFNYAKEGPGVAKNAPKKRALFAFTDIYGRKFWKLALAGLLWAITALPIVTRGWADAGLTFITRNFSREKHAFIKEDFFEAIKKNRRNSLIVGILNLFITGVFIYNIALMATKMMPALYLLFGATADSLPAARNLTLVETVLFVLSLMGYVTFTWMKYYIPFLLITFKLNLRQIYKNAFLFAGANMKVNLLISVILIVVYGLLLLPVMLFNNLYVITIVGLLWLSVVPAFRSLLIQYSIFPAIRRLIIDPYYEAHPQADKQLRLNLNLEVEEETAPVKETEETEKTEKTEEENAPIFTDTLPAKEDNVPKKGLPKQYNEKELRRFNRQVQSRTAEEDDDTI